MVVGQSSRAISINSSWIGCSTKVINEYLSHEQATFNR
jgi:hypothetical protein